MKINGNAIRVGNVIQHDGGLWAAVKTAHVKPGKGGAFAQVELKNLIDGRKLNERFRSSDTVERVTLEQKEFQFLYEQGEALVFMDQKTYDQIELQKDFVGEDQVYLGLQEAQQRMTVALDHEAIGKGDGDLAPRGAGEAGGFGEGAPCGLGVKQVAL